MLIGLYRNKTIVRLDRGVPPIGPTAGPFWLGWLEGREESFDRLDAFLHDVNSNEEKSK